MVYTKRFFCPPLSYQRGRAVHLGVPIMIATERIFQGRLYFRAAPEGGTGPPHSRTGEVQGNNTGVTTPTVTRKRAGGLSRVRSRGNGRFREKKSCVSDNGRSDVA